MFGFGRKKALDSFKTVDLPGEAGTISIPSFFTTELEGEATLLAYCPQDDAINLRVSSLEIIPKSDSQTAAFTSVLEKAQEEKLQYTLLKEKCILEQEAEMEEEGLALISKQWEIGIRNTLVILSASIVKSKANQQIVKKILAKIPQIIESIQITLRHEIIETDEGRTHITSKTVDPWPHKITPFGPYENRWLEDNLYRARQLGIKYGSGGQLEPQELDVIFSRWISETETKEDEETIVNALGAAFGAYLANRLGFEWFIMADDEGREYMIRHTAKQVMAFPRSSVYKRIVGGDTDFFHGIYMALKSRLENEAEIE